ncbi:LysR family transcriptional regulator [Burkholderia ubonensis]|uniref:LysR family transcriptional regulator n=1 Tax=Burkholderia ubonensis TaxID=101571 RepID=UPI000756F900|nr:LysR family transcriptional regulator [Burkholderia ubonensis]KVU99017.1 LysR family transcriptional regulator [Burkholderia ubonensis]
MEYIDSLRIFCSVVEARSFRRAADILGLSAPVVSRAIAGLEKRLGIRLFNRTTRQISLTEAAEQFYEGCTRVLADLDALEESASMLAREPTGVLRVIAHATAATSRITPLLASFKRKHPKIDIDVTLAERPVDLVAEGFDVGLLLPFMLTSDTVVTRLVERIPFTLVASPDYLKQHAAPQNPADLDAHVFVAISPSIRKAELTFRIGDDDVAVPFRYEIASNNAVFNLGMVLQGFGLGLLPSPLVQDDLASGRLVRVLDSFRIVDAATELRLAYSSRTLLPAKVRTFIDHAVAFFDALAPHSPPA